MLEIFYTAKFKKDFKRLKRQGKDMSKLSEVLQMIASGAPLPESKRDHLLSGSYKNHRECRIEPDWLLIYRIEESELVLTATRTGSHSELFDS